MKTLVRQDSASAEGLSMGPTALSVAVDGFRGTLEGEVFGHALITVRYKSDRDLRHGFDAVRCPLTTTIHARGNDEFAWQMAAPLISKSGRLVGTGSRLGSH